MPRGHEKKGANSGRPPTDDSRIAHGMHWAERIEGRDSKEVIKSAAELLTEMRRAAADTKGKRHQPMSRDSARRRVLDIYHAVFEAHGHLAGLPPNWRTAGAMLADIARRDGFDAGCAALSEIWAWVIAGGPTAPPDVIAEARVIAAEMVRRQLPNPGEIP